MSDLREAHRMLDALLNPAHGWENCGTDVTRVIQRWRRKISGYGASVHEALTVERHNLIYHSNVEIVSSLQLGREGRRLWPVNQPRTRRLRD